MQDENPNKVPPRRGNKFANFTGKGHKNNDVKIKVSANRECDDIGTFEGSNHTENTVIVSSENGQGSLENEPQNPNQVQPGEGDKIAKFSGKGHSKNEVTIKVQNESRGDEISIFEGEDHMENKVVVDVNETIEEVIQENAEDSESKDLK